MPNWSTLKAAIANVIKTNGNQEITGQLLQNVLNNVVSSVGENATFVGIATPATNPGVPDGPVFYLATELGTYANFNGIEIRSGETAILEWRESWKKKITGLVAQQQLSELGGKVIATRGEILTTNHANNYDRVKLNIVIPKGTKIRVDRLTGFFSSMQSEVRQDVVANVKTELLYDVDIVNNLSSGKGKTNITIYTPFTKIAESDALRKEVEKLADIKIDAKSINLVDKDRCIQGLHVAAKGDLLPNELYGVTPYIRLTQELSAVIFSFNSNNEGAFHASYDSNLNFIKAYKSDKIEWEEGVAYVRFSFLLKDISTVRANYGNTLFPYKPYDPVQGYMDEFEFNGQNVKDGTVTINKLSFVSSENLIDINDPNYQKGYYINSSGNLSSNNTYDTTGFIPIEEKTKYVYNDNSTDPTARFLGWYDSNFSLINSLEQNAKNFASPENAKYARITVYSSRSKFQFEKGTLPTSYKPYKKIISQEFLPTPVNKVSPYIFLPPTVYVAVGRTIEIYYDQVILYAHRYNIKAICNVGIPMERKFQIIGSSNTLGKHTLTITAYDDEDNAIAQATSTIVVVNNTISKPIKVLPIGDSLTNLKPWLNELSVLSSQIKTVGTRKNGHEGRSGADCKFYNGNNWKYTFDKNYIGTGSDAEEFSELKSYKVDDFAKKDDIVYVFTKPHTGTWNEDDVYPITTSNPFWNYKGNRFSMNWYKSFQSISYDIILIWLGTNGINLTPETNPNGALGIKQLVDLIRQEDSSTPIIIVNTIYRSGQNGIGRQGNTDGYKSVTEDKYSADKKVLLLARAVDKLIGKYENVYMCPVGATHDSKYNFMIPATAKVQVNPRLQSTETFYELVESDSVHPHGYMQAADEIFSTICASLNK